LSAVIGCAAAVVYHVVTTRMQLWLAVRLPGRLPLLSVASMLLRLSAVGLLIIVIHLFTPLSVMLTAVSFVGLFTLLSGFSLYRFAVGRGPLGTSAPQR
jgi:hypothetical protein